MLAWLKAIPQLVTFLTWVKDKIEELLSAYNEHQIDSKIDKGVDHADETKDTSEIEDYLRGGPKP